jgi:AmmeMemoRadiSam system protein B
MKLRKIHQASKLVLIIAFIVIILIVGKILVRQTPAIKSASMLQTHPVTFFDERLFMAGIAEAEKRERPAFTDTAGGIVPHHELASGIIANFFKNLAASQPKTIILLGPNHSEHGRYRALTSRFAWKTKNGNVMPAFPVIDTLIKNHTVMVDEKILPDDQALATLMPYIKYYLPDVTVAPILLSSRFTAVEVKQLAASLSNVTNKDTAVIASADFSHYLPAKQAEMKDSVTYATIKRFDYPQLLKMSSDYLDSPVSVAVFLMLMQQRQRTNTILLDHTNSGILTRDPNRPTTSYFSLLYY